MRLFVLLLLLLLPGSALGASPSEIFRTNAPAVAYLEVRNANGAVVNRGSGFVVSPDGFVVTVAHLKVTPTQKLFAVLGQREGTSMPLFFRDTDEVSDVAIWQLPPAQECFPSVAIASRRVSLLDSALSLGFPGPSGLTPNKLSVNGLRTARGYLRVDGFLESGTSGGPVFNDEGRVIGIVHGGGLPGTENNELIPISLALNLLQKWNAQIRLDGSFERGGGCRNSVAEKQASSDLAANSILSSHLGVSFVGGASERERLDFPEFGIVTPADATVRDDGTKSGVQITSYSRPGSTSVFLIVAEASEDTARDNYLEKLLGSIAKASKFIVPKYKEETSESIETPEQIRAREGVWRRPHKKTTIVRGIGPAKAGTFNFFYEKRTEKQGGNVSATEVLYFYL